jgi:flavodoxin/NAD-dependent dihydropyrimidine dehydrogenase PreA subunit
MRVEGTDVNDTLIVYFSQGGTNKLVAASIGDSILEAGHGVDLWNLKDGPPPSPLNYKLFGIGTPTYYYRAPFNVTDYVNALPDLTGLSTFVFVVHGAYRGSTGNTVRQALGQKGAREIGYFHCLGADFFLGYLKEGYLLSPDNPTKEELNRARDFGREVAARFDGAPYVSPDKDPPPRLIYRFERFLANRVFVKHIYSQNIRRDGSGRLQWGRNCLLCLSCEMNCPEDAITSPVSWTIFRPFMVLNTWLARRDPSLKNVRVVHRRGVTTRL